MAILLRITVPNPDDILSGYGAGALIRIERSATEGGVYAEIDTEAVVAGTFVYEVWDATGASTSWYRTRYSDAINTLQSEYGHPWSQEAPVAFATLDDLLLATPDSATDSKFLADAQQRLVDATGDLVDEVGYTVFRTPATGTEARIFDGDGTYRLHVHEGIAELETVEIRLTAGGDWVELPSTDYYLEAEPGILTPRPGDPHFHVCLEELATHGVWPSFRQGVRLTLATGWPAIPSSWREATVALARQRATAGASLPGSLTGPEGMRASMPNLWPRSVYDLVRREAMRHACSN